MAQSPGVMAEIVKVSANKLFKDFDENTRNRSFTYLTYRRFLDKMYEVFESEDSPTYIKEDYEPWKINSKSFVLIHGHDGDRSFEKYDSENLKKINITAGYTTDSSLGRPSTTVARCPLVIVNISEETYQQLVGSKNTAAAAVTSQITYQPYDNNEILNQEIKVKIEKMTNWFSRHSDRVQRAWLEKEDSDFHLYLDQSLKTKEMNLDTLDDIKYLFHYYKSTLKALQGDLKLTEDKLRTRISFLRIHWMAIPAQYQNQLAKALQKYILKETEQNRQPQQMVSKCLIEFYHKINPFIEVVVPNQSAIEQQKKVAPKQPPPMDEHCKDRKFPKFFNNDKRNQSI